MSAMPIRKPETLSQDKIIVPASDENYMEIRHLVLHGSDRDIGFTLGNYARDNLGADKLAPYRDPIFGRAREAYLKHNFPALWERSLGVADAYGVRDGETGLDTTSLPFGFGSMGCSAVFFPADVTAHGRPLVARNLDFYIVSARELETGTPSPNDPNMFSRSFLAELYPDSGFSSMQTTGLDLLNFPIDGINEHGLFATLLTDQQGPNEADPFSGGQDSGISSMQVIALLMNKCKTVEEAKMVLLQNRIFLPFEANHWLIADEHGASTIFEIDGKSGQYFFVDGEPGKPQVITNHSVHRWLTIDTFPSTDPKASYNSFNRYRVLTDSIKSHSSKFSVEDCFNIISEVFAHSDDSEESGAKSPYPIRTLWTYVMDLAHRNMTVKYYLKDDPATKGQADLKLEMTDPLSVRLAA